MGGDVELRVAEVRSVREGLKVLDLEKEDGQGLDEGDLSVEGIVV